jgi:hypothetical protein
MCQQVMPLLAHRYEQIDEDRIWMASVCTMELAVDRMRVDVDRNVVKDDLVELDREDKLMFVFETTDRMICCSRSLMLDTMGTGRYRR